MDQWTKQSMNRSINESIKRSINWSINTYSTAAPNIPMSVSSPSEPNAWIQLQNMNVPIENHNEKQGRDSWKMQKPERVARQTNPQWFQAFHGLLRGRIGLIMQVGFEVFRGDEFCILLQKTCEMHPLKIPIQCNGHVKKKPLKFHFSPRPPSPCNATVTFAVSYPVKTPSWTAFGSPWCSNRPANTDKKMYGQKYRICRNKRPGRLIFRSKKKLPKPIKPHRFCVLPPLKNHPSKAIGFVYSPLWKITVFGGRLFQGGRLFRQIRYVINKRMKIKEIYKFNDRNDCSTD